LNPHIELPEEYITAQPGQIPFTVNVDMKKFGFRTMHQSLMAASEGNPPSMQAILNNRPVLDDRIDSVAEILQQQYSIPIEDFTNPSKPSPVPSSLPTHLTSQNEIVAVGRICLDPPTTTARLTPTSLVLESSRRLGAGSRVPLNLSGLSSFSLFPGQVVGVRGVNAQGTSLVVKELLVPARLPCPDVVKTDLLTSPLKMIVASGPWGTDVGGWEEFEGICNVASTEQVDVLILVIFTALLDLGTDM
jgi:DNA polymerase alpha subunit B